MQGGMDEAARDDLVLLGVLGRTDVAACRVVELELAPTPDDEHTPVVRSLLRQAEDLEDLLSNVIPIFLD